MASKKAERRGDPVNGGLAGPDRGKVRPTFETLQAINNARGDKYPAPGRVYQEDYDIDYEDRGYAPVRTGEVRVLDYLPQGKYTSSHHYASASPSNEIEPMLEQLERAKRKIK